jgi:phage shock protein B
MGLSSHLTAVLIVAIVVLGPILLGHRYRHRRSATQVDAQLGQRIDELTELAARMQRRIEALEGLLEIASTKGRADS